MVSFTQDLPETKMRTNSDLLIPFYGFYVTEILLLDMQNICFRMIGYVQKCFCSMVWLTSSVCDPYRSKT